MNLHTRGHILHVWQLLQLLVTNIDTRVSAFKITCLDRNLSGAEIGLFLDK